MLYEEHWNETAFFLTFMVNAQFQIVAALDGKRTDLICFVLYFMSILMVQSNESDPFNNHCLQLFID